MELLENVSDSYDKVGSSSRVLDVDKYFDMITDEVENKGIV